MALRAEYAMHYSGYERFLYAPLWEEQGNELSVLSALARLGVDPWAEAARLGELPRPAAAAALAESLSQLPGQRREDHADRAHCLVALLPTRGSATEAAPPGPRSDQRRGLVIGQNQILLVVLLGALLLFLFSTGLPF